MACTILKVNLSHTLTYMVYVDIKQNISPCLRNSLGGLETERGRKAPCIIKFGTRKGLDVHVKL